MLPVEGGEEFLSDVLASRGSYLREKDQLEEGREASKM